MTELIPFDQAAADDLDSRLSGTLFRSTSDFIAFYNSGLANKTADDVVGYANDIDEIFKNVRLQGKNLVFISVNEVYMTEINAKLAEWDVFTKVKRAITDLVSDGTLTEDSVVVFTDGAVGVLQSEVTEDYTTKTVKVADEKFFKSQDAVLALAASVSSVQEEDSADAKFVVSDFVNTDDSFVKDIHDLLY